MIQHAEAVNARLRKAFSKGFALDATHHPHISILQRYVHTADLDKIYDAVGKILAEEEAAGWSRHPYRRVGGPYDRSKGVNSGSVTAGFVLF
jgi:hypothetical protein